MGWTNRESTSWFNVKGTLLRQHAIMLSLPSSLTSWVTTMPWYTPPPDGGIFITLTSCATLIKPHQSSTPGESSWWQPTYGRRSLPCCMIGTTRQHQRYLDEDDNDVLEKIIGIMNVDHPRPQPHWGCRSHPLSPYFLYRVQMGYLEENDAGVKKCTVERYLHDVAQIFTSLGDKNPCLYNLGRVYFWFIQNLCAYKCANPNSQPYADNTHLPN